MLLFAELSEGQLHQLNVRLQEAQHEDKLLFGQGLREFIPLNFALRVGDWSKRPGPKVGWGIISGNVVINP